MLHLKVGFLRCLQGLRSPFVAGVIHTLTVSTRANLPTISIGLVMLSVVYTDELILPFSNLCFFLSVLPF